MAFLNPNVYNVDETGIICTVHTPWCILGPKGQKHVRTVISWGGGQNVTIVCSVSAFGNYIPQMLIYPRKRMYAQLQKNDPGGAPLFLF